LEQLYRNISAELLNPHILIDNLVTAISIYELLIIRDTFSVHIQNMFLSYTILCCFKGLRGREGIACAGVIHWVLRRSVIQKEIVIALTAHSSQTSLTTCTPYMAKYIVAEGQKILSA